METTCDCAFEWYHPIAERGIRRTSEGGTDGSLHIFDAFDARNQNEARAEWFQPVFDVFAQEAPSAGFAGEYWAWNLGAICLTRVSAPATRTVRTSANIRRNSIDHWVISYGPNGSTAILTANSRMDARAGVPFSASYSILCDRSCMLPISEIAASFCFSDPSSFSRAFRREFGIAPTDVRECSRLGLPAAGQRQKPEKEQSRMFSDCLRCL